MQVVCEHTGRMQISAISSSGSVSFKPCPQSASSWPEELVTCPLIYRDTMLQLLHVTNCAAIWRQASQILQESHHADALDLACAAAYTKPDAVQSSTYSVKSGKSRKRVLPARRKLVWR